MTVVTIGLASCGGAGSNGHGAQGTSRRTVTSVSTACDQAVSRAASSQMADTVDSVVGACSSLAELGSAVAKHPGTYGSVLGSGITLDQVCVSEIWPSDQWPPQLASTPICQQYRADCVPGGGDSADLQAINQALSVYPPTPTGASVLAAATAGQDACTAKYFSGTDGSSAASGAGPSSVAQSSTPAGTAAAPASSVPTEPPAEVTTPAASVTCPSGAPNVTISSIVPIPGTFGVNYSITYANPTAALVTVVTASATWLDASGHEIETTTLGYDDYVLQPRSSNTYSSGANVGGVRNGVSTPPPVRGVVNFTFSWDDAGYEGCPAS